MNKRKANNINQLHRTSHSLESALRSLNSALRARPTNENSQNLFRQSRKATLPLPNRDIAPTIPKPPPPSISDLSKLNIAPLIPKPLTPPRIDLSTLDLRPSVPKLPHIPRLDLGVMNAVSQQTSRIRALQSEVDQLRDENAWLNNRIEAVEAGQCSHRYGERNVFGCYYC